MRGAGAKRRFSEKQSAKGSSFQKDLRLVEAGKELKKPNVDDNQPFTSIPDASDLYSIASMGARVARRVAALTDGLVDRVYEMLVTNCGGVAPRSDIEAWLRKSLKRHLFGFVPPPDATPQAKPHAPNTDGEKTSQKVTTKTTSDSDPSSNHAIPLSPLSPRKNFHKFRALRPSRIHIV